MSFISEYIRRIRGFSPNAKLWLAHCFTMAIAASVHSVIYTLFLLKLGHGEQFIGSYYSLGSATIGIVAVPMGLLLSKSSRKVPLMTALVAQCILGVTQTMVPVPAILLLTCVLINIGETVSLVCQGPLIMDNSTPKDRTYLYSVIASGTSAVFIVGTAVAGRMPAWISARFGQTAEAVIGFRYSMLVGWLLGLLALAPLFFMRETQVTREKQIDWRLLLSMPSKRALPKVFSIRAAFSLAAGLFLPFVPVLMKTRLGASTEAIGMITSLASAGATVACLFAPMIERPFGMAGGIAVSLVALAPFVAITGLSSALPVVAAAVILREMLLATTGPLRQRILMEVVTPEERPVTASLDQLCSQIPWAAGVWLGGRLIPAYGYPVVAIIAALIWAATGLGYGTLLKRELREAAARQQASASV